MHEGTPQWLALANTALIVVSGLFLLAGYAFIRRRHVAWHHRSMLMATVFAGLFLVVYITRDLLYQPRVFAGQGGVRVAYLVILASHTVLAVAVGPLALVTLRRAFRRDFRRHRRIARLTLPIWLYVVVTGWVIYLMLYSLA
jgi:putative membrane protein